MVAKELWGGAIVTYLIVMLILRNKRPELPVWSIMSFAMFLTIISGLSELNSVGDLINIDVILFLIGMFSLVSILDYSGVIEYLAAWFVSKFKTRYSVLYAIAIIYGLLSAYTVNDALTLVGTPLALIVSKIIGVEAKVILLLIAFSITIGSVMTPVGNPQNMLISSSSGMPAPFIAFTTRLATPTILNLIVTTKIMISIFKIRNDKVEVGLIPSESIKDKREALIGVSLFTATIILFILNDVLESLGLPYVEKRGLIPFITASIAYILSKHPRKILSGVSWGTIIFFISMFITMNGIWRSGVLQPLLNSMFLGRTCGFDEIMRISLTSIIVSQLLSNVPFTNLFIHYMKSYGYTGMDVKAWLTLAMSATIAGNLTVLGAASNIIMIETVEQRSKYRISFLEFLKIGSIITFVNLGIYLPFLLLIP